MSDSSRRPDEPHWDPVYLHARREALVILLVWAVCLVWAVGGSVWLGYERGPGEIATVLGIPRWVMLAIALPWLLANVFAAWFCFRFMADDDLGQAQEDLDLIEEFQREDEPATERRDA